MNKLVLKILGLGFILVVLSGCGASIVTMPTDTHNRTITPDSNRCQF